MIFRFGRFVLNQATRELRLGLRAIELQPRVFDLLVYLVQHRQRVVPKDELLAAIWPGVLVTDSSIMRAVSVIRTNLREGGLPDAIQTFSRQGYRFICEVGDATAAPPSRPREVERAHAACERADWKRGMESFRRAEKSRQLQAGDFERWAYAALSVGQPTGAIHPLECAVAAHSQNADRVGAARAALTLANVHLEERAPSVAKGWHRRAAAFLADESGETREHGLHAWLAARLALFESDLPRALALAKEAEALARRIGDPDIEALGLLYRGQVELATGQIREALVRLEEAGAATLAGVVSPWVSGIVFCAIIWAHLDRGDLHRAGQWTTEFTRWVKSNAGFGAPGLCRLHRGEVLCIQGELQAAESEIGRARELLAESARYAEGDAYRVLGEIRLLRGDHAGADEAFRQAHELGWDPLLGRALLQAETGQLAAAIKSLQRGLESPNWADGQRRGLVLAQLARLAALAGRLPVAKEALQELKRARALRDTPGCEASFHHAAAEVALAEKHPEKALAELRAAIAIWQAAGSRINAAHLRLRLAQCLAQGGDWDDAELELVAAEKAFAQMGAEPMVARCQAAREELQARRAK